MKVKKPGLDRNALKYIAIIAMTLDHVAWFFLDFSSPLAQIFHIVGRITAPVMCFFLAQGFRHTTNRKKYAIRLLFFAVISQVPWILVHGHTWDTLDFNMMFTLFISLCVLICGEFKNKLLSFVCIAALVFASLFCDWIFFAPLFTVVFMRAGNSKIKQCVYFSLAAIACIAYFVWNSSWVSSLYMFGLFLCIPLLLLYNGQKGKGGSFNKWFFYLYYPLHLFIIAILQFFVAAQ